MSLPWRQTDNRFWPLPPDHLALSASEQRLARIRVVSTQTSADDFVRAWAFFRSYYLRDQPKHGHFPGFYDEFIPSPPFHRQMVHNYWDRQYNLFAAPRGSAKSVVLGTEVPLVRFLGGRGSRILLVLSILKFASRRISAIREQLEYNERILEDFGPLKPKRNDAKQWNNSGLQGLNGSEIIALGVTGRMRGIRATDVILDDPEFDAENPENRERAAMLTRTLGRKVRKVLLPMMRRMGKSRFCAVGTTIRRDMWLHQSITSDDPIWNDWTRTVYAAELPAGEGDPALYRRWRYRDEGGRPQEVDLIWPELWPPDALAEIKAKMLSWEYASEYLNRPISEQDATLRIHPHYNTYTIEKADTAYITDPLASGATLRWWPGAPSGDAIQEPAARLDTFGEFLRNLHRRLVFVDPGGDQRGSDWTAIHVIGLAGDGALWSLDLNVSHDKPGVIFDRIWETAIRWRAHEIWMEALAQQRWLVNALIVHGGELRDQYGWRPQVRPLTYKYGVKKEDRICQVEWRMRNGLVRLPIHRKDQAYGMLFEQIAAFTPDGGGLQNDDALDTLAMADNLLPARALGPKAADKPKGLMDRIRAGHTHDPETGMDLRECVRPEDLERVGMSWGQLERLIGGQDDGRVGYVDRDRFAGDGAGLADDREPVEVG